MFVILDPGWIDAVTIRLKKTDNLQASINTVKGIFEKYAPAYPFEYRFADVEFQKKFTTINLTSTLASLFASLTIIITGLGLFGLASFTAEQRTKEIGIRKVLGASISSIVMLLSKEFGKLVLIAFILAAPMAWYGIDWWLREYTYKTDIGIGLYLLSGLAAFLIAWVTMSFQSFKAAASDPVKSLKSE